MDTGFSYHFIAIIKHAMTFLVIWLKDGKILVLRYPKESPQTWTSKSNGDWIYKFDCNFCSFYNCLKKYVTRPVFVLQHLTGL